MLAKTTDGGRTWSSPKVILPRGSDAGSIASVIVPDPRRGRLNFAFWQVGVVPSVRNPGRLVVQSSSDGGGHWSSRTRSGGRTRSHSPAASVQRQQDPHGIRRAVVRGRPEQRRALRGLAGRAVQQAAARPDRARPLSRRRRTWSSPQRLSRPSVQAFVPVVAVAPNGTVGVAFYETAAGRSRHRVATRYVLVASRDGGRTFARRTVGPAFDLAAAPLMQSVPEASRCRPASSSATTWASTPPRTASGSRS